MLLSSLLSSLSSATLKVDSIPQPSPELKNVPLTVLNCSLQWISGVPLMFVLPCDFMYTKSVPIRKASWYLRLKESNSSIMKPCCSRLIAVSFMLNWMVSFGCTVSICEIGSRKSSFVIIPTSLSLEVTARHEML